MGREGGSGYRSTTVMHTVVLLRSAVCLLGRFPALAGADLTVERGEIVLLRGPNGAGKTTLLRVCAGLVPVTQGEAVVLGHDLTTDWPQGLRRVDVEHPSGHLVVDVELDTGGDTPRVRTAGVVRTARKLFAGKVFPRA